MPYGRPSYHNPTRPIRGRQGTGAFRSNREEDIVSFGQFPPQTQRILRYLLAEGSVTNCEAHTVLCARSVSRRITTLRRAGVFITKRMRKDFTGQRYVRYELVNCPVDLLPPEYLHGGTVGHA